MSSGRRYDIDWLRVIAIGLLIIYHVAIGFQPWGVFIGFIQNNETSTDIWIPMSMLNIWRIPFLFFVSGMGVWFAIQRRSWKQLILERSKRILLPFIFGTLAIVPIHVYLWQVYYYQAPTYTINPAHLWFLGNIFIYVFSLSPLFFYLKNNPNSIVKRFLTKVFGHPLGLLLIFIPFVIEAELVQPESFEMYAMTWHGFFLGFIAFLAGFCCVYAGSTFWTTVSKYWWTLLIIGFSMYLVRVTYFDLRTPDYLMATESCFWVLSIFGIGYKYLNKPSKYLTYLSEAAYPIYILHMIFLYLGSTLLFETGINIYIKMILLNAITLAGCFITYELIVKRIKVLRLLFGLKTEFNLNRKSKTKIELV